MMRGSVVVAMMAVMGLMVTGQHSVLALPPCDGRSCPEIYQPVCGTDWKTYDNNCYFSIAKCKDRTLRKLHQGPCAQQQHDCHWHCTMDYNPVCGSDGKTYPNQCHLEVEKRCVNPQLKFVRKGECNKPPIPPDCPRSCTLEYAPVCGSDGRTYDNLCWLEAEKCTNPKITLVSNGECPTQQQHDCPGICTADYRPVCGSDGKTYGNLCALEAEKRCVNPQLTFVSDGECPKQQLKCPGACIALFAPVCGSDGKTYSNSCELLVEASCNNKPDLYQVSDGPC